MSRKHTVTVIPGDGIGPEITEAMLPVINAACPHITWELTDAGAHAVERYMSPLPEETIASLKRNRVGLKGPTSTPSGSGWRSVNVAMRKELDAYACVRPIRTMRGVPALREGIDIVIVRENTEDLYAGIEFPSGTDGAHLVAHAIYGGSEREIDPEAALGIKVITPKASRRIITYAFEYARRHKRKKVTCVHKANIQKYTDGLFRKIFLEIAREYPEIESEEFIVDAITMRLVQHTERFDVIVTMNLYGDILSDLCAGLVGGLGVAAGANIGDECALFEATHGTAPDIAGKGIANPTAMLLSAVMMLEHLGEPVSAYVLKTAIEEVLAEGLYVTGDIFRGAGAPATTTEMCDVIRTRIDAGMKRRDEIGKRLDEVAERAARE